MPFTTYENRVNKHVTIHADGCRQIAKHGGQHKYGQGGYHKHAIYQQAQEYAQQTTLPLVICSFCKPADL